MIKTNFISNDNKSTATNDNENFKINEILIIIKLFNVLYNNICYIYAIHNNLFINMKKT